MAKQDTMQYFDAQARGEPIRMVYVLANQKFIDERVELKEEWPKIKPGKDW